MKAVHTDFAYLNQSKHNCISAQIYAGGVDIVATLSLDKCSLEPEDWPFMVDADHSGNAKAQTRRRSQNGLIIKLNRAHEMFESKASSIGCCGYARGLALMAGLHDTMDTCTAWIAIAHSRDRIDLTIAW